MPWRYLKASLLTAQASRSRNGASPGLTFESLCDDGPVGFDPSAVTWLDEPAGSMQFFPLTDVTGRMLMERRLEPAAATDGEPRLPEEFLITDTTVILSGMGWVVTRQGWLVPASVWRGHSYLPAGMRASEPQTQRPGRRVRLPGVTLNCMSDWAARVYGHCLWESVYRILLHWDLHGSFDAVDWLLAPPMAQRLLGRFDPAIAVAAAGKFVDAGDPDVRFVCEAARVSPHPLRLASISRRQVDVLRRHARPGLSMVRRVFLDRTGGNGRSIVNRDEVLRTVRAAGYEPVDAGTSPDVFGLFHHATHVAGVHGSDMADIVFMQPGARVLELTPTDHVAHYFRCAGAAGDLDYRTLFVASDSHRLMRRGPSQAAVTVDCVALADALRN
jgi:hypothetical protein